MADTGTRERIFEAANQVFVDKGFNDATIRDICSEAGTNVAAVNYHFRDKQKLYTMVLAKWVEDFVVRYDRTEGTTPASSLEDRLRAYIRADLKCLRLYDAPSRLMMRRLRLVLREITSDDYNPEVFKCHQELENSVLFPMISGILGPAVDKKQVKVAGRMVAGMLTQYFIKVIQDPGEGLTSEAELEDLADSLTMFAFGGLSAFRDSHAA